MFSLGANDMGPLSEEIIASCEQLDIHYEVLDEDHVIVIRNKIESTLAVDNDGPLWDRLHSYSGIYDQYGWSLITNFTEGQPIIIFFEPHLDKSIIYLKNSQMLSAVLGNCSGFVFYIANLACDYLFCFNDHDALLGAGTAEVWVNSLIRSSNC